MAWMILCTDRPEAAHLRADPALMAAHWAYEQSIRHHILAAGSLRTDDGTTPTGSLLILDVATADEALELFAADPATQAGLRAPPQLRFWNPAILAGVVLG